MEPFQRLHCEKDLQDGSGRIRAFPEAQIPSWPEADSKGYVPGDACDGVEVEEEEEGEGAEDTAAGPGKA